MVKGSPAAAFRVSEEGPKLPLGRSSLQSVVSSVPVSRQPRKKEMMVSRVEPTVSNW